MKIYTKSGDKGQTSLASGKRVSKSDERVGLYGTCDEFNSSIGLGISLLNEASFLKEGLVAIQNILFELGSELAGFRKEDKTESIIFESDISFLEKQIDIMQGKLVPLKSFILPGGSKSASALHISRTICRRLEREMVRAQKKDLEIFQTSLVYVNRLSDYLFVAARFANTEEKIDDIKWVSRAKNG